MAQRTRHKWATRALAGREWATLAFVLGLASLSGCHTPLRDARDGWQHSSTLTFLIESSPNNLDLRQGTDAQSERVGELIYDPLVQPAAVAGDALGAARCADVGVSSAWRCALP
jgi:hypothetical protein